MIQAENSKGDTGMRRYPDFTHLTEANIDNLLSGVPDDELGDTYDHAAMLGPLQEPQLIAAIYYKNYPGIYRRLDKLTKPLSHADAMAACLCALNGSRLLMNRILDHCPPIPQFQFQGVGRFSSDVARAFFSYYSQYAAIISSGLVAQVLSRDPSAVTAIRKMSFERAWSLVSALLQHVQGEAEDALTLDTTTAIVHQKLLAIREQLKEQPELELDQAVLKALEETQDRPARQFLLDCVPQVTQNGTMDVLKERFAQQLKDPRMKRYEELAEKLSNLIAVSRTALTGKPHLEFLFHGLCDSRALTDIISCSGDSQFRKLFQDISFDPDASARELELLASGSPGTT